MTVWMDLAIQWTCGAQAAAVWEADEGTANLSDEERFRVGVYEFVNGSIE